MSEHDRPCPDCDESFSDVELNRRTFIKSAGALAAAAATGLPLAAIAAGPKEAKMSAVAKDSIKVATPKLVPPPETGVKRLFDSLTEAQRKQICFEWAYQDPKRGLLRTFVANNWKITKPDVNSNFFTGEQKHQIREIFEGIIQPDWHARIDQQLDDDAGGFGHEQSIAIFGKPGHDKFEFVMTGRHMTLRCDGHSAEHVAFGGPIFYGHAASGFDEPSDHPGNVFWPQAQMANKLYQVLDRKQHKLALVTKSPPEQAVSFRGARSGLPGLPASELSPDQMDHLKKVLAKLIEPYRQSDRDDATKCLAAQGGLQKCSLAFYSDHDIGNDGVWDNWRLEGPSFVWYFRGSPHVHVWVNVADDPKAQLNERVWRPNSARA